MILGIDCSRYAAEQPTGVEVYTDRMVEGLLTQLPELGYEQVRLYVKTPRQLERLLRMIEEAQLKNIEVVLIERQKFWTLIGLSWQLLWHPVDVLFVPSHTMPIFTPRKSLLTVHGLESYHFPDAYSWFQRFLQSRNLAYTRRKGTRLMAVSKAVRDDLLAFAGIPSDQVVVVWNGFDEPEMKDLPEVGDIVKGEYLLSVGRLEERKNQRRLVQAFDIVAEQHPKLSLVLVGPEGQGVEEVRAQVEASPYRDRIILAGYQERAMVQALMQQAKVLCYPSLAEGFGIPILEGFAAGVPVLTSKGSACEEVAGEAAVLVDPLVVASIVKGLEKMLVDGEFRNVLVERGEERMQIFSWERCVKETADILKALR